MKLNKVMKNSQNNKEIIAKIFKYFVFAIAFILLFGVNNKVGAISADDVTVTVNGSLYNKTINDKDNNFYDSATVCSSSDSEKCLDYIEGKGIDSKTAIDFTINNFPEEATSFIVVEQEYSDSASCTEAGATVPCSDLDRYSKTLNAGQVVWTASSNNVNIPGESYLDGSATFDSTNNTMRITYRLRNGTYGLKRLRIYFYDESLSGSGSDYKEIYYVLSRPIDLVSQETGSPACITNEGTKNNTDDDLTDDVICTNYVNGSSTRETRTMQIYIPYTVAYNFASLNDELTAATTEIARAEVTSKYKSLDDDGNLYATIYAVNVFYEKTNGDVSTTKTADTDLERNYAYVNFVLGTSSKDTQGTVTDITLPYINNLSTYKANRVTYLEFEVDATGTYFFYITDIFGNVSNIDISEPNNVTKVTSDDYDGNVNKIKQEVTDVKNRSINTIVKKSNAKVEGTEGYDAEENFTNESVKISLTMTLETNFEYGYCINNLCTEITKLKLSDVRVIKYWRVDVENNIVGDNDKDAFDEGDTTSSDSSKNQYASETYAVKDGEGNGMFYFLVCKSGETSVQGYNCSSKTIQNYNSLNVNNENGSGFYNYDDNTMSMYVALNGRYRFYIEDVYGNNSWGTSGDLSVGEYRNPRVEVYAIDKAATEITFETGNEKINVSGLGNIEQFDINTYNYYRGILTGKGSSDTESICYGISNYCYDARVNDDGSNMSDSVYLSDDQVYYPITADDGRTEDTVMTYASMIYLSHTRISDYIYYYDGTKDLYSDYSTYDRNAGGYYVIKQYSGNPYDRTINTIKYNVKNNSNGFTIVNEWDSSNNATLKVEFYHKDGSTRVCEAIAKSSSYSSYGEITGTNEIDCVNFYLDHGVDFIMKVIVTDEVGNTSSNYVYINVIDDTSAGFSRSGEATDGVYTTDLRRSNAGTECRMEIGSSIGNGQPQDKAKLLDCYKVTQNSSYSMEDNRYSSTSNDGLAASNRVNNDSHIKIYIYSDESSWIDLETSTFVPNKTGYYTIKLELIDDTATDHNTLYVFVSYYVDKKIVLVTPVADENKFYGEADPTFDYCVSIDVGNNVSVRFSENPYSDVTIYTKIYCTTDGATGIEYESGFSSTTLFQSNTSSAFGGSLNRLETSYYNANKNIWYNDENTVGVQNDYVGIYNIILGTLNINKNGSQDDDYIVKIHPSYRTTTKHKGTTNDNLIAEGNYFIDDTWDSQSNVDFTIKQIVLDVTAAGGSKNYGSADTNYANYNNNTGTSDKYLNGFGTVTGLITSGQIQDTTSIILGVLRRKTGENVGIYTIYNYRGTGLNDNNLETYNNMYLMVDGDEDETIAGITLENYEGLTNYTNGILNVGADYIKSRALYIQTNKQVSGKTLNVTTDLRNNTYANYVINYSENTYVINAIDLVLQAAPGQRREYNYTDIEEPDPWEIILYGLVDDNIRRESSDTVFNGYTVDQDSYSASNNDTGEYALITQNKSETRTNWYLYHDSVQLTGLKTNQTYTLLRSTNASSVAGTAILDRERVTGDIGGWYLFKDLAQDANVLGDSATEAAGLSTIAVITNDKNNCTYDTTGHFPTVSSTGTTACKNYNLIMNHYYTDEDGYTYENKATGKTDADYVYKSTGITSDKTCQTLDGELPCENTATDSTRIYKIQFEIYRRKIVMEFNSALEKVVTTNDSDDDFDIVYGKRYTYYKTNLFDIEFYVGKESYLKPEGYLFLCYTSDSSDVKNPTTNQECTTNKYYGLTEGDTWQNIELQFRLHSLVSDVESGYYSNSDDAIPAGVYFVYADIKEEQKKNYNFIYYGGTLTIKSKTVNVEITSYQKEYGEAYYSTYGADTDYANFTSFVTACMHDGEFANTNDNLVSLGDEVYCQNAAKDLGNTLENIYGFHISGLDNNDTIAENFSGRPNRIRSSSASNSTNDTNALQDNVGSYNLKLGTIRTILNNEFQNSTNACQQQVTKGTIDNCVLLNVADATENTKYKINNYVIGTETRTYIFNFHKNEVSTGIKYSTSANAIVGTPVVNEGYVFITPAEITITVASGQTKMYGCAYNVFATTQNKSYTYADGYSSCVENDSNYYDMGYKYSVEGDKDYYIANNGFYEDYSVTTEYQSYDVSGIYGTTTFRPSIQTYGIKTNALNATGTLYRVALNTANISSVKNKTLYDTSISAQLTVSGSKTYQLQEVGTYLITLGSVDAMVNTTALTGHVNVCDDDNLPTLSGTGNQCKNYIIKYYGTRTYNGTKDIAQKYNDDGTDYTVDTIPTEMKFTIYTRTMYLFTKYDQKIYGDADQNVTYLCGDYNGDGVINDNDLIGSVNGDVYYGVCSQQQVDDNMDGETSNNVSVNYGLTKYFTKYNSLAKYPWNGNNDKGVSRNDVQTDVITGKISRKGMGASCPSDNDIKGFYEYVYTAEQGNCFGEANSVRPTAYGNKNYTANYYENGHAVDINGNDTITDEDFYGSENVDKPVEFEIVLRKIQVAFVPVTKIYGEADDSTFYNILVCAPGDEFDFANMRCITTNASETNHGLSSQHKTDYTTKDADNYSILNQTDFKEDFYVKFKRVLGETVACGTSSSIVNNTLTGFFYGSNVDNEGTRFTYSLNCKNGDSTSVADDLYVDLNKASTYRYNLSTSTYILDTSIDTTETQDSKFIYYSGHYYSIDSTKRYNKSGDTYTQATTGQYLKLDLNARDVLAYIDQSSSDKFGYNYEISYTIGTLTILKRTILITPDSNQGFNYGDYYDTLIPHITFTNTSGGVTQTDELTITENYGLVNGGSALNVGVCLHNINYFNSDYDDRNNKENGTCFNINDRQDEYSNDDFSITSSYDSSIVNYDTGLTSTSIKNYVFGDIYTTSNIYSDTSGVTRSALNRVISTGLDERYNRNVGTYKITIGDLADKSGNYILTFTENVEYKVLASDIYVEAESTTYANTTQTNQYKIYGEQDKEITFTIKTTYIVKYTHFAKYDTNILTINGDPLSDQTRYKYDASIKSYIEDEEGTYLYLTASSTVILKGFAYNENVATENLNYGSNHNSSKQGTASSIDQSAVTGAHEYDVAVTDGIDHLKSYASTDRILLGYLYVQDYSQSAGTYLISNGLVVANNEWGNKNYSYGSDDAHYNSNVNFTIIPRPIGIKVNDITKTYGQTTDKLSCDNGSCTPASGILSENAEGYLKYNFEVVNITASTLEDIVGNNINLYTQNGHNWANVSGLVPGSQNFYSTYYSILGTNTGESKNSGQLGVYVSRDERSTSNKTCLYSSDKFGFCEDVGTYSLRLYGYLNDLDNLSANSYSTVYKPASTDYNYTGSVESVEGYYYSSYFGYNPNYFVVVVDNVEDETDITNVFVDIFASTTKENVIDVYTGEATTTSINGTNRENTTNSKLVKSTAKLTINKKDVDIYVNTSIFEEGHEIYNIQQNTNPPSLPVIDNTINMNGVSSIDENSYAKAVWGLQNAQVRTGDKMVGTLAYCNSIITNDAYTSLKANGLLNSDYTCENLIYEANKNDVDTNLEGFIPIVRDIDVMSIVSGSLSSATPLYERSNYNVTFYPGALEIEEDATRPVVNVLRSDVYIEANAVGTYSFDCVYATKSTTYSNCTEGGASGNGYTVVGKTGLVDGNPILNLFNQTDASGRLFYYENASGTKVYADSIIQLNVPSSCSTSDETDCGAASYYEQQYGKYKTNFVSSGGIKAGIESTLIEPFTIQRNTYINNSEPQSLKQMMITLVNWFNVQAYDESEIRNGVALQKDFDKYWYIVIEKTGTNGEFKINKVGEYKLHFFVMDNAGNVSEETVKSVATLHIIDTTDPIVGTLNLYNGKVKCNANVDCTIEDNWYVAEDTYLPVNTLGRYSYDSASSTYSPSGSGTYVIDGSSTTYALLADLTKYVKTSSGYKEYELGDYGNTYIKINQGYKAIALKHYTWSNSTNGIYLTITGGSDNSYTETVFSGQDQVDYSQWNNYYSRDGGITWFNFARNGKDGLLALAMDGTREIMIKSVDSGVSITAASTYNPADVGDYTCIDYYGSGSSYNHCTTVSTRYSFADSSVNDIRLKYDLLSENSEISDTDAYVDLNSATRYIRNGSLGEYTYVESPSGTYIKYNEKYYEVVDSMRYVKSGDNYVSNSAGNLLLVNDKTTNENNRTRWMAGVGWNVSKDSSEIASFNTEDTILANKLSLLYYGETGKYTYKRDTQTAYLDRSAPTISFITDDSTYNGEKLYVYEYGCSTCTYGYTEYYAGATDEYKTNSTELAGSTFDKNNSLAINHKLFNTESAKYIANYKNVSSESLSINKQSASGLGSNNYALQGKNSLNEDATLGLDIRNVYYEERKYIIYAFDSSNNKTIYDLSSSIPRTNDTSSDGYEDAQNNIYNVILHTIPSNYSAGDVTYTIVYSVIDKAGNEASYIARGVIFSKLLPEVEITPSSIEETIYEVEKVSDNTYEIDVTQGDEIEDIINSFVLSAGNKKQYITQSIYFNGELISENKAYNKNISKDFSTNESGVYEIIYNLSFIHYGNDGSEELMSADPIKLIINIERALPVVSKDQTSNYNNMIALAVVLLGTIFVGAILLKKKRV